MLLDAAVGNAVVVGVASSGLGRALDNDPASKQSAADVVKRISADIKG